MRKATYRILLFAAFLSSLPTARAQVANVENSLFWEVTGNGINEPSYLFGTFHLMGSEFIDSLANVKSKFASSKTFAGELVFDSTMTFRLMTAALMQDTTLQELLDTETYDQTSQWLKELSGFDLTAFNKFNPVLVQMMIMNLMQQKISKRPIVPMDIYFQNLSHGNKAIIGLETFDDQVNALFKNISYKRQAEKLRTFVIEKKDAHSELIRMNTLYRQQNLDALEKLLYDGSYSQSERDILVNQRNREWMKQLPFLFLEESTFVAVGALHLAGENGIVQLLRNSGFTVTPIGLH